MTPNIQQVTLTADTRCQSGLFSPLLPVRYDILLACFVQVWFNFASDSPDDHMPRVVDVCSTAGHVIFAVAACHPSLP